MGLARYVVEAVVLEGRSYREVARAHGVSKSWVGKMVSRFHQGGYEALSPRSRAPAHVPNRTPPEVEEAIVRIRRELVSSGFDAGAQTIFVHLAAEGIAHVPSVSTIWRVLKRRGFVTPQPHKRPRSSWNRFEAALPNERWQSDVTHWRLSCGTDAGGAVTLRHAGRLHHIGVGRIHRHKEVIMLVADLDVRILTDEGEMLRHLTLDPTRDYQAIGRPEVSTLS